MAWETRKGTNNVYYTRSYRSDGDLVREYLGNGPRGREAARQCDKIRELRDKKRRYEAKQLAHFAAAERACDEYCRFVELALHAYMAECGYHYHRGEWRKRRVPKVKPAQEQPVNVAAVASEPSSQSSEPKRSHKQLAPRRRSMPQRRPLDCRLGLVRGIVVFRSAKARPFAERKTTECRKGVGCFCRLGSVGTTKCFQCEKSTRPLTLSTVGKCQLPRPPPMVIVE